MQKGLSGVDLGTDKFVGTPLNLSSNCTDLSSFWILSLLPSLDCPVGALLELLVGVEDTTPKFPRLNWTNELSVCLPSGLCMLLLRCCLFSRELNRFEANCLQRFSEPERLLVIPDS